CCSNAGKYVSYSSIFVVITLNWVGHLIAYLSRNENNVSRTAAGNCISNSRNLFVAGKSKCLISDSFRIDVIESRWWLQSSI
ncbi:hypothetical protein Tco_1114811, partial [Tanacetum coccineum]